MALVVLIWILLHPSLAICLVGFFIRVVGVLRVRDFDGLPWHLGILRVSVVDNLLKIHLLPTLLLNWIHTVCIFLFTRLLAGGQGYRYFDIWSLGILGLLG